MSIRCAIRVGIALGASAPLHAQLPKPQPRVAPASDRVQVTALNAGAVNPVVGTPVTIRATIRNADPNYALDVPWQLTASDAAGSRVIASGLATALPGGASVTVSGSWSPTPGPVAITATADPAATIGEVAPNRSNNAQSVNLIPFDVRLLTFTDAVRAGARFTANLTASTQCPFVGVVNASDPRLMGAQGRDRPLFIADCVARPGMSPILTGAKANPVAFEGLSLRNGWSVRRVDLLTNGNGGTRSIPKSGGSATSVPQPGSTSPAVAFGIWADRGGAFEALVEVWIQGPAHLSPLP